MAISKYQTELLDKVQNALKEIGFVDWVFVGNDPDSDKVLTQFKGNRASCIGCLKYMERQLLDDLMCDDDDNDCA